MNLIINKLPDKTVFIFSFIGPNQSCKAHPVIFRTNADQSSNNSLNKSKHIQENYEGGGEAENPEKK